MAQNMPPVDAASAEDRLMRFLAIEGVSGQEKAIAEAVIADLKKSGVPEAGIRFDDAHKRIPLPTQTGNLFASLPGTRKGPRLVFATHLDTVPLCAGAKPKRDGGRIVPEGKTALGGDNRTGCAVLATLAETLLKHRLPHPPITLVFTVREESGLQGAKYMDAKQLEGGAMCFNVDAKLASELVTGAVGAEKWEAEIHGKASHAGVAPEKGISSTLVAAIALAESQRRGWWGKVSKPEGAGTSNAGIFGGREGKAAGDATNVVTDYAYVRGETRSADAAFASKITAGFQDAFRFAAEQVKDSGGEMAEVKFKGAPEYPPFKMKDDEAAVRHAARAAESLGLKPKTVFSNGGLDANWFVKHGLPTVTFGAGQHEIHTVHEYVDLALYLEGCRMAVALATLEA
ncbi:MAG: M20/M25/M40 family metallo-hydrolase [Phycisphaerales bacterium]|nr:M20/M25/M40 family metallo-hydrolase [Phycisphaerales bacterium]